MYTFSKCYQADVRSAATSRQQVTADKDENKLQAVSGASARIEEKTRRLLAGGEGLDHKIKKKRSVGAVSNRIIGGERDIKRATHPKLSGDSKLRICDAQGFRYSYNIYIIYIYLSIKMNFLICVILLKVHTFLLFIHDIFSMIT